MVHAVVRSMVLRIRLRSRMWWWHDLDTAEIWSEKVRLLSKMTLSSSHPAYLHSLVNLNHSRSTRSSSLVTLNRPSNPSHLQITNRSFYHTAPALWNRLPSELRQLAPLSSISPFVISLTLFHKRLKNSYLSFFFSTLVCTWPRLHLDGYPRYWPWLISSLPLFVFWLCTMSENKY